MPDCDQTIFVYPAMRTKLQSRKTKHMLFKISALHNITCPLNYSITKHNILKHEYNEHS